MGIIENKNFPTMKTIAATSALVALALGRAAVDVTYDLNDEDVRENLETHGLELSTNGDLNNAEIVVSGDNTNGATWHYYSDCDSADIQIVAEATLVMGITLTNKYSLTAKKAMAEPCNFMVGLFNDDFKDCEEFASCNCHI